MLRVLFLIFLLSIVAGFASAQNDSVVSPSPDTLPKVDSPRVRHRPAVIAKPTDSIQQIDTQAVPMQTAAVGDSVSRKPLHSTWTFNPDWPISVQVMQHHPYYAFGTKPVVIPSGLKVFSGKEVLFYVLIGFLLAFALLRQSFPKYFNDIFRLLFRTTMKQKQIREQLMQTPLPSLLSNAFFAISGGLYIALLLSHFGLMPVENFWLLFLYCSIGLAVIYMVKYLGLKVTGWLFNIKSAADSYIFVVYIINKVIGIFLLPFLVLLSFLQGDAYAAVMIISFCGVGVLFMYRFLLTYTSVRNQVRFNLFHFFLYLCAFEVAPLLLIYKGLLFFFP